MRGGRNEENGPSAQTREIPAAKQESPQPAQEGRVWSPPRRVKPNRHKQPQKRRGAANCDSAYSAQAPMGSNFPENHREAFSQKITGKHFLEKRDPPRGALVRMTYNKADCNGISCARTSLYDVRWLGEAAGRPLALEWMRFDRRRTLRDRKNAIFRRLRNRG